jgi:hypothetical protein
VSKISVTTVFLQLTPSQLPFFTLIKLAVVLADNLLTYVTPFTDDGDGDTLPTEVGDVTMSESNRWLAIRALGSTASVNPALTTIRITAFRAFHPD